MPRPARAWQLHRDGGLSYCQIIIVASPAQAASAPAGFQVQVQRSGAAGCSIRASLGGGLSAHRRRDRQAAAGPGARAAAAVRISLWRRRPRPQVNGAGGSDRSQRLTATGNLASSASGESSSESGVNLKFVNLKLNASPLQVLSQLLVLKPRFITGRLWR
jgi:hypothetical protein